MSTKKYITPGARVMDNAWHRDDRGNVHTGEALLLALILHTKGKTKRGKKEVEHLSRLLDDPNMRTNK